MAHRRKPLVIALGLNTAVLAAEMLGGVAGNSFSLIMDGVHNISDELGIGFLVLAYTLRTGVSGNLLRSANLFNSVGLLAVSGFLILRVVEHLFQPTPVLGLVSIIAGLIGALGNWGVATVLRQPSKEDAAIRLAYVHNLADTLLSLVPVAAGALTVALGNFLFDPLFALFIAGFIVITTLFALIGSRREFWWPERVVCK